MKLSYNDRQHAYWLDGKRCKGVTTIADTPHDKYNLHQWELKQVALGLAHAPALLERIAVDFDDYWAMQDLIKEAKKAAGATKATERGTTVHRVTERQDLGQTMIATDSNTAIAAAWQRVIDEAGFEVVPEFIERIVVYPSRFVAGRFDRLMRRKGDGKLVIVDAKSGQNELRYPHKTAIQLALYANAPLLAAALPSAGGSTEEFEPLPDNIDREVGWVIHMPVDGEARAVPYDIAAAWECVERIIWPTLEWRDKTNIILDSAAPPAESKGTELAGSTSMAGEVETCAVEPSGSGVNVVPYFTREGSGSVPDLATLLTTIKTNHPDLARLIAKRWPYPGVGLADLDEAQTAAVSALVDEIAIEGAPVPDEDIALVQKKYTDLTKAQAARIHVWLSEADGPHRNGARGFGLGGGNHSERRLALVESCVAVAQEGIGDQQFREFIATAMGITAWPAIVIGEALAAMNWREAQALFGFIRQAVGAAE